MQHKLRHSIDMGHLYPEEVRSLYIFQNECGTEIFLLRPNIYIVELYSFHVPDVKSV